jgi:iron complex transport system permease protein
MIKNNKIKITLISLLFLLVALFIVGITTGVSPIRIDGIIRVIIGKATAKERFVLLSLRLPRLIITFLAGAALSVSGAILKTLIKNDLADPGILGINAGAGVGVALFYLFVDITSGKFAYVLPIIALIGGLIAALIIYFISHDKFYGINTQKLIFAGIGSSMALSGLMVILLTSSHRIKVEFISRWLSGNIWGADWPYIIALLPWVLILIPYVIKQSKKMDIMLLSESTAISLGVDIKKSRFKLFIVAVALASAAVAVVGSISFIGLIAPHIAKKIVGQKHKNYLITSVMIGGNLLLMADIIGHNLITVTTLPAGIVVALIGAPYFIWLLLKE